MAPRPHSREASRASSVLEDGDGDSIMTTSRPASVALMPPASACFSPASPPSLRDILTGSAPPPYTLGAFMAFLSQNHCLETLEFTMDAERYRTAYSNFVADQSSRSADGNEHVCCLWQKLMNAYILPYGHREVNLPAHVRDRLLSLPATPVPPHPSELDEAARIVYELMNDSVMGPFLASMAIQHGGEPETQEDHEHPRSRPKALSTSSDESSRSSRMAFLPLLSIPWTSERQSSGSSTSDGVDRGMLTDDGTNTPSPTGNEPVTPPTTPPLSDSGFNSSPGGLQKAISSHSSGWKKMGAKLGLNRMGRSKRGHSSSATSAPVEVMPIHEDTVTASPGCTSPAPENGAGSDGAQAKILTPRTSWEEPHPGQRYSISVVGNARPGAANGNHSCNGAGKVGVAAIGYAPYPTRGWAAGAARKFAPPRLRTASLRPLKVTNESNRQARLSAYTTHNNASSTDPIARGNCPSSNNHNIKRPANSASHLSPSDQRSQKRLSIGMTDFSGFLKSGPTTIADSDSISYMSIDVDNEKSPSPPPRISPDDESDPYGWEAELDKRLAPPNGVMGEYCPVLQYRRAGGAKRTLLQRVLSFGPRE
ncbi:hypothetical protein VTI74DRAFT_1924 [Chaetomium olivicolor]